MLIFLMLIVGVIGVITVDIRTGEMAGFPPAVEVYVENVEIEEKTEGYAVGYELIFIVNNKEIANKLSSVK